MLIEILGWAGMLILVLIQLERVKLESYTYPMVNILGAVLVGLNAGVNGAWPAVALEAAWIGTAIVGLVGFLWKRKLKEDSTKPEGA